jgi:hypothetical protein
MKEIFYIYKGMVIKGAKLGNAYKWSSIKNRINYEQERDRTIIYKTNIRSKSRNAEPRSNTEAYKGAGRIPQQDKARQSSPTQQHEDHGILLPGASKEIRNLAKQLEILNHQITATTTTFKKN